MRSSLTRLRSVVSLVAIAIAVATSSSPAVAQAMVQVPGTLSLTYLLGELARAGVRMPPEQAVAACQTYIDDYEEALLKAIKDAGPSSSARSGGDVPVLGIAAVRHRQELEARVFEAENRLRNQLFDALVAAARPEDREVVEAERVRQAIQQADSRLQGELSVHHFQAPDDIGGWILARLDRSAPESDLRHALLIAGTNGEARVAALVAARKRLLALELDWAKNAEQEAAAGRQQGNAGWRDGGFDPGPETFAPSTDEGMRLVQVQLDTYRLVLPELTEAERTAIRAYWVPRMLGIHWPPRAMPRLMVGGHQVGPYVTDLIRCRTLDDGARERVRELGRAWVKDDDAIIDRAMDRLVATGKPVDVTEDREARARKAREAFAKVKGLEWLGEPHAEWPPDPLPPVDADTKEFGVTFAVLSRATPGDGEEEALAPGLPVGYSRRNEVAFGDLLRLDETQRIVLATVLADAREQWATEVQPLIEAARPKDDGGIRRQPTTESLDARRAALEARGKAWDAAATLDETTFGALETALGERFDVRALTLVRASRVAGRVRDDGRRGDPDAAVDVASRILDTPVSSTGRAAAIAAAAPLVVPWMAEIRAADVQRMRAQLEDVAAQRTLIDVERPRNGDNVRMYTRSEEFVRADEAARAMRAECNRSAEAIESAVLAAAEEALAGASEDVLRFRLSFACMHRPDLYRDLRPLWAAIDRSFECVPAGRRDAVRAAAKPIVEGLEARVERLGLYGAAWPNRSRGDDPLTDARMQLDWTTSAATAFAAARLDAVVPSDCWDRSALAAKSFALRASLERLASNATTTPTP